jgi:L-alanine-DL-glutamate epimerase-like enolase superfamily enzyme
MMLTRKQFLKATVGAAAGAWSSVLAASTARAGGSSSTGIAVSKRRLNLRHTWTISRNSSDFKDNVFVCIERDGTKGWGEAAPNVRYGEDVEQTVAGLDQAKEVLRASSDWFDYVDLRQQWEQLKVPSCAAAALDMAVLDWVGRRLNVPLYRLLGLDPRKAAVTSFSIGIDTPEVVQQKVKEAAEFPILKIKVGRDNDAEILAAVRAVTDRPLRVDANEGWRDRQEALEKIRWLAGLGVELVEQPMPADRIEDTAWLSRQVDIPIIADEAVKHAADIPKLAGAYDGINIKLMKAGGIQEAIQMIHVARALGLKVMLGCMIESSVAVSAAAHLTPLVDYADLDGNLLIANDPFQGVSVEHGKLILSDRPGLGVSERPEAAGS